MYKIIAMCIEHATVLQANNTRLMHQYKAVEGVPCCSQSASCKKAKICKERWMSVILYVMSHPGSNPSAILWPLSMAIYGIFPIL